MFYLQVLSLILLRGSTEGINESDFEKFSEMVKENILNAKNYVRPIDNSDSVRLIDSKVYDFGCFDFIIIGAGSAGTVLANRLSERKDWRILLLEAGEPQNEFTDFPGIAPLLQTSNYSWGYLSAPQEKGCLAFPNNQCPFCAGKGLGGTSIINYMLYIRGNREDYDLWGPVSNREWNYDKVLPYFKKSELCQIEGDEGYHGKNGELAVNYTGPPSIYYETFLKSFKELNIENVDYNGRTQNGYSRVQANINFNKRASGARTFIDPIRHRKNLVIKVNSFVTKVLFDKSKTKAIGAYFVHKGKLFKVKAGKEVILSAGATNTPQILMWSGIGPKKQLQTHGIEIIKQLEHVGANLGGHPNTICQISTNLTQESPDFMKSLKLYYDSAFRPFNDVINVDFIQFLYAEGNARPDIELFYFSELNALNFYDENFQSASKIFNKFFIQVVLLHPNSLGTVTLKSKNPKDFPLIDMKYYTDPEGKDMDLIYKGIQYVQKCLETGPMKSINATLDKVIDECSQFDIATKHYWYCAIPYLTQTPMLPMGSTRMGLNASDSVVDSELRVHGLKSLRIVDAGVFPTSMSGHLNPIAYISVSQTFLTAAR